MLRKLSYSVLALTLALALAEVLLRTFYPVGGAVFRIEEELLFEPIPHASNLLRMPGDRLVRMDLNSRGQRGPELEKRGPGVRIAVYGDSLVMAENVPFEATYTQRLAVHGSAGRAEAVEVVNAGVTGYGPDQVLLKLERELGSLEADFLVVVLCATNDFGDLLHNKLFRLDADGALARNDCELDGTVRERFAERIRRANRPALLRAWEAWRAPATEPLEPYDYVGEYLQGAELEYDQWVRAGNQRVIFLQQDYYDADIAIVPEQPSAQLKVNLMRAVLLRMRELAESRGLPLVAVVVPSAVDLDPEFDIRVDRERYPAYDPARLVGTLTALLSELGVPYLDLTDDFAADPGTLFEGGEDFHWNAAGQDLAARRTLQRLLELGLPPG